MKIKTGLILAIAAGGIAQAEDLDLTQIAPAGALKAQGHVYINYHTGERVISAFEGIQHTGANRGSSFAGWDNSYPDPCDPTNAEEDQGFWFTPVHDADLGDEPTPNPQAVSAWQDWIETEGDATFSIISFGFATFVPDPDPAGSEIEGHDMFMAFTENDRATNRSGAVAHSPLAVTSLPGDVNAGGGTLWIVSVDFDPDGFEIGDTDGSSPDNPPGVDVDGDGLIDSGFIFTYNQPNVGEGDVLASRFPELAGAFDDFADPLDVDTFPNILDMGPGLGHPSAFAGVGGEANCYDPAADEWPQVAGCDDQPTEPLGSFDAFGLIDQTGADVGAFFFGGFACVDNGPGLPFNDPWAGPVFAFGVDLLADPCPCDLNGDGILDLADIGAFVVAFQAGDLAADLNGDGILDLADIGAFVTCFQAGCP
jgi:hypothetical protein